MIGALIVAGSQVYCDALADALGRHDRIRVVGTATSAERALVAATATSPELVLLELPIPQGPLTVQDLLGIDPRVRVVAFAVNPDAREVGAWAAAGVAGCVARDDPLLELIRAAEAAINGDIACSPCLAGALFKSAYGRPTRSVGTAACLTARERQILLLIAEGRSNKQIAGMLHLQVATVKNHTHSLFNKLGVHRRAEAVDWFLGRGDLLPR